MKRFKILGDDEGGTVEVTRKQILETLNGTAKAKGLEAGFQYFNFHKEEDGSYSEFLVRTTSEITPELETMVREVLAPGMDENATKAFKIRTYRKPASRKRKVQLIKTLVTELETEADPGARKRKVGLIVESLDELFS